MYNGDFQITEWVFIFYSWGNRELWIMSRGVIYSKTFKKCFSYLCMNTMSHWRKDYRNFWDIKLAGLDWRERKQGIPIKCVLILWSKSGIWKCFLRPGNKCFRLVGNCAVTIQLFFCNMKVVKDSMEMNRHISHVSIKL